ncbi:radical SAM protein [Cytobacillus spongiae]|jgi:pyruvate formate-lyase activating enzyme-like uncharacterized protein|uniref:radical SAM protein n=1 Tax=Cytobacillus spongiae TaxID=2901381 RepID=UPI001F47CD42|nr:radical SAM protein [Cytobacillus spongiae]UII56576.1 radical SAM protein [Cytobacillus spongiae]
MIKTITRDNINEINNPSFRSYVTQYLSIEEQTNRMIEGIGLPFSNERKEIMLENILEKKRIVPRNENKSLYLNWISPACKACKTGEKSHTTFISFKCHKKCFFCFNPNQENYGDFRMKEHDVTAEIQHRLNRGEKFDHIALTGGEPLLHPKQAVEFFEYIDRHSNSTYTRLYTAGDLITRDILRALKSANLNEIRFSIKQEESEEKLENLYELMILAKEYIPFIVVEMPVIPGTLELMKKILHRLDEIGVNGINLLEFCFPMHNSKEFQERGYELKFPPFETYYNYWYAGGLAVDKSEEESYHLLQYASEQSVGLGVHYCSLENKHTGQLYQQNKKTNLSKLYSFSEKDFFIKSAKVFGADKKIAKEILNKKGVRHFEENATYDSLQFPASAINLFKGTNIEIAICSYVSEIRQNEDVLREVKVEWVNGN